MNDEPLVSVIMSTFNEPQPILGKAVFSILDQTYSKLEFIIIVDNPDNIENIEFLKQCGKLDKRIKLYINENNMGLVKCLNFGITKATSEYIVRMDADDISCCYRIEKEIAYMTENNFDAVCSSVILINELGNKVGCSATVDSSFSYDTVKKIIYHKNLIFHPTVMIKKNVIIGLDGYRNIKAAEDYDLWLRLLSERFQIGFIQEALLSYRINSLSISRTDRYGQFLGGQYARILYKQRKKTSHDLFSIENYNKYLLKNHYYNDLKIKKFSESYRLYLIAKEFFNRKMIVMALYYSIQSSIKSRLRQKYVLKILYHNFQFYFIKKMNKERK